MIKVERLLGLKRWFENSLNLYEQQLPLGLWLMFSELLLWTSEEFKNQEFLLRLETMHWRIVTWVQTDIQVFSIFPFASSGFKKVKKCGRELVYLFLSKSAHIAFIRQQIMWKHLMTSSYFGFNHQFNATLWQKIALKNSFLATDIRAYR